MEYDFQEQSISELIPAIFIPSSTGRMRPPPQPLEDLDQYLQEQQMKEKKKIEALQRRQQHIAEQVEKQLAQKEDKLRRLQQEQREKKYAECTFQPKTGSKNTNVRNLEEFLEGQKKFTQKVMQKRDSLKKALDSQKEKDTHHPKINTNKQKGNKTNQKHGAVPEKKDQTVFERLYALKDKQNESINHSQSQDTFHPQIQNKSKRLSRNTPIDQLLYSDALRRQEKTKQTQLMSTLPQKQSVAVNFSNERYVAQKFIKEYFQVLQKLGIPSSLSTPIDYLRFGQLLLELGFTQEGGQETYISIQERALIHDAYQMIEGKRVNARNVCVFLLGLLGIYHINPVNFQEGEQSDPQLEFNLQEPQGRRVQKHFDLLKRNRLFSQRKTELKTEEYRFQPIINPQSEELAERHRANMLNEANLLLQTYPELDYCVPQDGMISHTDLLVLNNVAKDIRLKGQKEEKQKKAMEEYTFKPVCNSISNSRNEEYDAGRKKSMELYNNYKSIQQKKTLHASRQVSREDDEECTFTPNMQRPKVHTDTRHYVNKDVSETVLRMRKGREQHQQKTKFLQRGEKVERDKINSHSHSQMHSNRRKDTSSSLQSVANEEDESTPTLILDVNLGDKVDRIVICKGDERRLEDLARNFAMKHQLEKDSEKKLCDMLHLELENMLARIDEEEDGAD